MNDSPLKNFRPAAPPPALRQQTLAVARAALEAARPTPTWWDRLWESRGLRLAWTAAVVLLMAVNLLLSILPDFKGTASRQAEGELSRDSQRASSEISARRIPEIPIDLQVSVLALAPFEAPGLTWGQQGDLLRELNTQETL